LAVRNALDADERESAADPNRSARWNRGAHLVKGPAHCGACHTPKNSVYAEREDLALSGNLVENWWAADLTADDREGLGGWSSADIVEYLKTGRNRHLMAAGPMVDVITVSTSRMRADDLAAIAAYLKELPAVLEPETPPEPAAAMMDAGRAQFRKHCQDCHNYDGTGVPRRYQALVGVPTVQARDPTTVLRVILEGQEPPAISARPDDDPMPGFDEKMTDLEVAEVATYIRNAWGNRAAAVSERRVHDLRAKIAAEPR
jgi:mono/diheme cytochrome c family protein